MPDIRLPFGIWTFDLGYGALLRCIRDRFDVVEPQPGSDGPANLIRFAYDWRLSNRYTGRRLGEVAEQALERWRDQGGRFADAQLVFITHSMGGLVARWYVDQLGGAELTRKVITIGTPHRGALRALEQLGNGVTKGFGPMRARFTSFARSLPSMYQLLPQYACVEDCGQLATTTERPVPPLAAGMVRDSVDFHQQIDSRRAAVAAGAYDLHLICGSRQPTATTATLNGSGRLVPVRTIEGVDEGGDGTVPRVSDTPLDVSPASPIIHHVADNHAGLVHNPAVCDELEAILTARPVRHRAPTIGLSVEVAEVLEGGEPLCLRAAPVKGEQIALEATVTDSQRSGKTLPLPSGSAEVLLAEPGIYEVRVGAVGEARLQTRPVTSLVLSWPPDSAFAGAGGLDE